MTEQVCPKCGAEKIGKVWACGSFNVIHSIAAKREAVEFVGSIDCLHNQLSASADKLAAVTKERDDALEKEYADTKQIIGLVHEYNDVLSAYHKAEAALAVANNLLDEIEEWTKKKNTFSTERSFDNVVKLLELVQNNLKHLDAILSKRNREVE